MPVIVFNKRTGKYLKRHSGSFSHVVSMVKYKSKYKEMINKIFGTAPRWGRNNSEEYYKYHKKVRQFSEDQVFNAEPGDARVYATKGSATSSVGVFNRDKIGSRTYILPDYLEIHEIKESFVCVMRPNGSSNCDEDELK